MMYDDQCPWLTRVSSFLDNELPPDQVAMVQAHASTCSQCGELMNFPEFEKSSFDVGELGGVQLNTVTVARSVPLRILLGLLGGALVVMAIVNFVRGSGTGEGMHDLRHLGIWQASLGVAVVALSVSFRLSLFLVATTTSFLLLTTTAAIFDLVKGHSGPWADITHLVEAFAAVLLLVLAKPRVKLTIEARRQLPPFRHDY